MSLSTVRIIPFKIFCICFQLAEREAKHKANPLRVKKLYVLAALLVEEHHAHHKQQALGSAGTFYFTVFCYFE